MDQATASHEENSTDGKDRRAIRSSAFAALLVFLSTGYIQNSRPGWNVNSTFALTCAIVEEGTLAIDDYHSKPETETGDKAYFDGKFYSDKSPVTAFLGVPAFWAYRTASRRFGFEFSYSSARYWTTWWSIGLSAAVMAWLGTILMERMGVSASRAALVSGLWILSTPLFGYSILYFNYVPSCALSLAALVLLLPPPPPPLNPNLTLNLNLNLNLNPSSPLRLFFSALLLGLAVWSLQTIALLALILTSAFLLQVPPRSYAKLWPWFLGGLLGISGYFIYSMILFGEMASPYRYEFDSHFRESMSRGLMGAGWPDPLVIFLITLHPFRGLFILFPATALAFLGLLAQTRKNTQRPLALIALALFAGLLLYNAGYYMWWGGWAYAPRHLIPALPLMLAGLAPIAGSRRREALYLLLFILFVGGFLNVAAVALDPQPPPGLPEEALLSPSSVKAWPTPFYDLLGYVWRGQTDPNWGTAVGLRGIWSLAPLAAMWAAGAAFLLRNGRVLKASSTDHQ
ncbi:hypothetical protein HYR69_06350 [Candidatus Sumerlaeota bacterium]|nr:hypothetical protein [Candidatus Sumerlaeota bacterium]